MLRLVKSVEERPEEAIVINWMNAPVFIKYGEDYYKVCFDIKRKPLSDNSLLLTKEEAETILERKMTKEEVKIYKKGILLAEFEVREVILKMSKHFQHLQSPNFLKWSRAEKRLKTNSQK